MITDGLRHLHKEFSQSEKSKAGFLVADLIEEPEPGIELIFDDAQDLPIYINIVGKQMLAICWLWKEEEVEAGRRAEMNQAMLAANIPMPLSSFASMDRWYVVFGALSAVSRFEDVLVEVETLAINAREAVDAFKGFLSFPPVPGKRRRR